MLKQMDIDVVVLHPSKIPSFNILVHSRATAATAAPTAPMFEPKTCAAPVAACAEVELVAVEEVGEARTLPVSYILIGHRQA